MPLVPDSLITQLERFGASRDSVVSLDLPRDPRQLRYLDLMRLPADDRPNAVVEFQGQPVLYVYQESTSLPSLRSWRRTIALRDEGVFLAISRPGKLTIHSVAFDGKTQFQPERDIDINDAAAPGLIPSLALQPPTGLRLRAVHRFLFDLLTSTIDSLRSYGVDANDALSLAGRALFFRFLLDRGLLENALEPGAIAPGAKFFTQCFDSATRVAATSRWLDTTFNGDLLPLSSGGSRKWFGALPNTVYQLLSNIVCGANARGQLRLPSDWSDINFAHVPVGLLSQVYESHCHHIESEEANKKSVYYTPRVIAEYMIGQAFSGMDRPHEARVLDPAAGAGVFLIAAFRRLVTERWRHDGRRPSRRIIRKILYEQLVGFDINESALRLAGLGLYLTALELDPAPRPLADLKFENLRPTVLVDLSSRTTDSGLVLGSLASVEEDHRGRYDLVIGNPPWTAVPGLEGGEALRKRWILESAKVVSERLGPSRLESFDYPDSNPDLPFFYRAIEWARPSGCIAFAVHARLLFRQRDGGAEARRDLFESLRITGILNGAALEGTSVWPSVRAPFCLVFAENAKPAPASCFYFASAEFDGAINKRGRFRVDATAAQPLEIHAVIQESTLLKTLFRGTQLDRSVMQRLHASPAITFEAYGTLLRRQLKMGYQVGGSARSQQDASMLHGLPDLDSVPKRQFLVEAKALSRFRRPTLLYPRQREIYRAPLVLIKESPPEQRTDARALLALEDVAYNRSFIGFSCKDLPDADLLARYLQLLIHTNIFLYHALLTSARFGVERKVYYEEDVLRFPVVPLAVLSQEDREQIGRLSDALISGRNIPWTALDVWAARLYGLSNDEREVIADTLRVNLPYVDSKTSAVARPNRDEIETYVNRLTSELNTLLAPFDRRVLTRSVPQPECELWLVLQVDSLAQDSKPPPILTVAFNQFSKLADEEGASEIVFVGEDRRALQLGILAEYRYWTPSRARLCAMDLLYEHEEVLLGGSVATTN